MQARDINILKNKSIFLKKIQVFLFIYFYFLIIALFYEI